MEAFWDYEDLIENDSAKLSILPDTATYLCFLYRDPLQTFHRQSSYYTRSGLAGFQSYRNDLAGDGLISGVSARLTAWGLNVFCPGVVKDCVDRRVDCRDLFPKYTIEQIEENLSKLGTVEARVRHVEHFLLSIINPYQEDRLIQEACRSIQKSKGTCQINSLAMQLGLGRRTLERRFINHIGVSPKKFARIVRLRHAILERPTYSSWVEVAQELGYFDQSHMIHDFVELYGYSPENLYPQINTSSTIHFSGLLNLCPMQ